MFARLTTIQGDPAKVADAIRIVEGDVMPAAKLMHGFAGGYWCADRKTGALIALTLFDSEKDLRESEAAASQMRRTATEKLGAEVKNVERFEVIAHA